MAKGKSKDGVVETVAMRVSKRSKDLSETIQKLVAVESKGEILSKTESLEFALEEFVNKRSKK